jgi:quinolinate synthase
MADMAGYEDAVDAWERIQRVLNGGEKKSGVHATDTPEVRVIPITYVNSSAAIKAFVGANGGACCTSSNAAQVFDWALKGGDTPLAKGQEARILFLPDQHLGRNTGKARGFVSDVDAAATGKASQMALWNPRKDGGGLSDEEIRAAKIILWAGHCSVHKLFRIEHVEEVRREYNGEITVLVHPECSQDVVDAADLRGSTEYIIATVAAAAPGTRWAVGTEIHLVNRLARSAAECGVHVRILSDCQCLCTTMYRIDQAHLLWVLDNLAEGRVVNHVSVHPDARRLALLALERMLKNLAPQAKSAAAAVALVD